MHRNKSVMVHDFSMTPRNDVPRSSIRMPSEHKTTLDAGYLYPLYVQMVYPGDQFNMDATIFARMATPIFPLMDNLFLDVFWFFAPMRKLWSNWQKFMGEQDNPADSISYVIPTTTCPASGYTALTIFDYMNLAMAGQVTATKQVTHSVLPLRMYNWVWNQCFRDENLQNSVAYNVGDGPDAYTDYALLRRGKRFDYFTQALPWPQKGSTAVSLPLGTTAPVLGIGFDGTTVTAANINVRETSPLPNRQYAFSALAQNTGGPIRIEADSTGSGTTKPKVYADLSNATAATINSIRLAFQTQKLLETDARGGTRYTEIIRSHFGVISPDARLQRPEYLGGGRQRINISPIAQTAPQQAAGVTTPQGNLAAMAQVTAERMGFSHAFTEHGYIMMLVQVTADLTYQQGMDRHWFYSTRYDFYWPAFAQLGERAILNREIYVTGDTTDTGVFGYCPSWDEMRYKPSITSGYMRSTNATPTDAWHLAQKFTALPTLNSTFIQDTPPISRVVAVGAGANGQQFFVDCGFDLVAARPIPIHSVPASLGRF